jgi:tetratricopeptide (TPR) repeat protein
MNIPASEIDPKLQNLWKKSLIAFEQKNWEYVVNLCLPIILEEPLCLEARKLLRTSEAEMFASVAKKMFTFNSGGMFKMNKKDPWEQIAELEENVFQKDPYSLSGNQSLYETATKLNYTDLASFALETIKQGHPTNLKNLHALANHYMKIEQPELASSTYNAIIKVDPRDLIALKGEKDAAAKSSMKRQGWDSSGNKTGVGDFRNLIKDADQARRLELENKQGMTQDQKQELLTIAITDYNSDNTNFNHVKKLAEAYERLDDLQNAHTFFAYALTLNPGDSTLLRKIEDIRSTMLARELRQMEQDLLNNPNDPDAAAKQARILEIKIERAQEVIQEAKIRVDKNPTDKNLRYELAQAYFNVNMFTEAIPELQQARSNPSIRIKSMLLLGRCFEKKNMNDMAKSSFAEAVKDLQVMDAIKKELLYELALVCHKMNNLPEYLEHLKEIYNSDYSYRDVAQRVEASYTS